MSHPTFSQPQARSRQLARFSFVPTLGFLFLLAWLVLRQPAAASPAAQTPVTPPSPLNGQTLFQDHCADCHGVTGLGDGTMIDKLPNGATALADPAVARAASPAGWFQVVKEGRLDLFMPPWKDKLTDAEIWDVVTYALTLHVTPQDAAIGAQLWGEQCADCHGQTGAGDGPQAIEDGLKMPALNDPAATADRTLEDWFTLISEGKDDMPAFGDVLTDDEIWAAATQARTWAYPAVTLPTVPAGTGVLSGQVVNGTTGQPYSTTVTLNTFENFNAMQASTVATDASGVYTFTQLPTGAEYVYIVTTSYGDKSFGTNTLTFPDGASTLDAPLQVFDASATPGTIRVALAQWFIDQHQGALLVGELYRITHDSTTVYTGSEEVAPGKNAVLRLNLPAGATSVVLDGGDIGDRFFLTADGVVDTQPLLPGGTQILLRYLLPYDGTTFDFAHTIPYATDRLAALVIDGPTVQTSMADLGPTTVSEQTWHSYEQTNIPADQPINLKLSGLDDAATAAAAAAEAVPGAPALSTAVLAYNRVLLYGIGALAFAAMLGLFAAYMLRRPSAAEEHTALALTPPAADADLPTQRRSLLAFIAQLDDLYASGQLDPDSYERVRAAQKRSLLLVEQQLATQARGEQTLP